jgi:hypothetical protein
MNLRLTPALIALDHHPVLPVWTASDHLHNIQTLTSYHHQLLIDLGGLYNSGSLMLIITFTYHGFHATALADHITSIDITVSLIVGSSPECAGL